MKIETTKRDRENDTQYRTDNVGVARLLIDSTKLRDLAVRTGSTDYIALAVDLESAWNADDVLSANDKSLLHQLFIEGIPVETVLEQTGYTESELYGLVNAALDLLRDDLTGYTEVTP